MSKVLKKPRSLQQNNFHYCPGCSHGIIHRLVAEVVDELDIRGKTIGIAPVGCSVFLDRYLDFDVIQAAHGRAPAVATGVKRALPDRVVFTYQGDGDLASIGMAEIVHAASRGENISVIFVNNTNYGMTGGQMAPTTLENQVTTTSPMGRNIQKAGHPIRVAELLSTFPGATYLSRVSLAGPKNINKAKRAMKKAFQVQMEGGGFSLVELLAICPINWRLTPSQATKWLQDNVEKYYQPGEIKVAGEVS